MNGSGKKKVINHHQQVPYRVLEEKYTYNTGKKDNMIIRGDNLETLKVLPSRHEGKIKCIHIDPPYNIAKSSEKNKAWVYFDNVDDPRIKKWLNEAVGDEGENLTRHDKWLCMMYAYVSRSPLRSPPKKNLMNGVLSIPQKYLILGKMF